METEETTQQHQEQDRDALPDPGPEYLISETGFGPTGVQESKADDKQRSKGWTRPFRSSNKNASAT